MKKLTLTFLTILFCLTSSVVWSETVKFEDLVKRNDLYYKKFTNVPLTGLIESYHKNGQLKKSGKIKKGIKKGLWESYYGNGQLMSKGYYKEGERDGLWETYFENGQLSFKGHYKDGGKRDGLWEGYHENGQLSFKGHYKEGKRDGLWEYFNNDGTIYKEGTGTYKDGKKVSN